ncbi:hypothetical protein Q4566_10825 [Tamlana sp. 2_MG-2023]|uniref:hypothetical protein n=1 Tax=unclassified Tamlana TaxID=2614803 RepID=UPI0026E18FAC|nr:MULTISPECIES: hypothetical protein [unclassified Tamlana]MDO6760694.1 hypothetical protein [Tamlana sp. 2_MG-2023]MDO6790950.1 hypothetical protein [Tamlana sp. 1_MG-2023]
MNIEFIPIKPHEKHLVLKLFKEAAERISKKHIDHWQYWKNPPQEKVKWVEEGIGNNEFFFIKNLESDCVGMVRVLEEDLLYWGKQDEKAKL